MLPQKNYTYYLEKEIYFCIFVVKYRILLPFHYNKFESNLAKGKRWCVFRQMIFAADSSSRLSRLLFPFESAARPSAIQTMGF